MESYSPNENLNFDKVWALIQETDRLQKETSLQMKETDRRMEDTDRRIKENERLMKNLMKKMSESEDRWGKFAESLVEGSLVRLLKKRNIQVNNTLMRQKALYNGQRYETDIIALNGDEIVAVEVKTTLKPDDVREFMDELKVFTKVIRFIKEKE